MIGRTADVERRTRETDLRVMINLDGSGAATIRTGLGFFNHMLTALALHARIDLDLQCAGDLEVDDHHTIEDCAAAIGQALARALGEKRGIRRFGFAIAPLDEALAQAVIDLSGRPLAEVNLGLVRDAIGGVACENLTHFFRSLAIAGAFTLHLDIQRGANDHHRAEAAFKAAALALRQAVAIDSLSEVIPSTKGVL